MTVLFISQCLPVLMFSSAGKMKPSLFKHTNMKIPTLLLAAAAMLGSLVSAQAIDGVPADYPLKKCPVSKEDLGSMGKPPKITGPDGTDVYLCCKSCSKDFNKEPAKYTQMVKDAKK